MMHNDPPILLAGILGLPPPAAAVLCGVVVLRLFFLYQDGSNRFSRALWIPAAWLFIISSRPLSVWLGLAPNIDSPAAYLEGSPIDRVLYAVLLISGVSVLVKRGQRVAAILLRSLPILLFLSYCGLSVIWSDYPFVAFKRWVKADTELVVVLILLTEANPMLALRRLLTRLGLLLLPLSVLFIKYYPSLGRLMTKSWQFEFTGVTTQKNSLGVICLIYGVTYVWSFRAAYRDRENPKRNRRLGLYALLLGIIAWLLWTCNAITSISGLLMSTTVMLIAGHRKIVRTRPLVHILVVGIIALSVFALFFDSSGALVGSLGRNATLTGRTKIWHQVLQVPINPLFGAGFESFWLGDRLDKIWTLRNQLLNEAHNGYLEVYLNLGWVGVGLLTLVLLTTYTGVIATFRQDPEWGGLLLAYLIGAIVYGLTEAAFRMLTATWTFLLFARLAATQRVPRASQLRVAPRKSAGAIYELAGGCP